MSDKAKKSATELRKTEELPVQQAAPTRALSPFEELDRMFESLVPRGWLRPWRWERPSFSDLLQLEFQGPRVDVIDREDEVLVKAEIPGVTKDDLEVSVDESTVTIKGQTSHEEKEEKGDYYRSEIRRGAFSRTIALPREVDASEAKATFKDGILELSLPKVAKSKRVAVKVE
jgi:HSP20 family protein